MEVPPGAEIVAPLAGALLESLRAFGYSTQAAVADLVDNSISAGAKNVWAHFEWVGEQSFVTVRDDGAGMSDIDLKAAMRPGSRSPLDVRDTSDLGRFGLGLKTASFSQCRRLTVHTRSRDDGAHTKRWDLDYVLASSDWWLLDGAAPGSEKNLADLAKQDTGTVVLWEVMDRLVHGTAVDDQRAQARFLDVVDDVDRHLAMVFHRFIERGLHLWVNGRAVVAWDPYLANETASQRLPQEDLWLHGETITVRPWVLPHKSKMEDSSAHLRGAGMQGWNAQQGFYVYRGGRLLVPGSWLGLGFKQEEHYKLARIALDLPNSLDSDWDIDVRKSRARPPGVLRDDLKRIARMTRERGVDVYRHRGKILARATSQPHVYVWNRVARGGKVFYHINRQHPLVMAVLDAGGEAAESVRALLRLVEETLPVPTMVIDTAEQPESTPAPFAGAPSPEIFAVLNQIFRALRAQGLTPTQVRERILTMEPFQDMTELVAALDDAGREGAMS